MSSCKCSSTFSFNDVCFFWQRVFGNSFRLRTIGVAFNEQKIVRLRSEIERRAHIQSTRPTHEHRARSAKSRKSITHSRAPGSSAAPNLDVHVVGALRAACQASVGAAHAFGIVFKRAEDCRGENIEGSGERETRGFGRRAAARISSLAPTPARLERRRTEGIRVPG